MARDYRKVDRNTRQFRLPLRAAEQFPRRALKLADAPSVFVVLRLGMAGRGERFLCAWILYRSGGASALM
jgi:hypothetical protein